MSGVAVHTTLVALGISVLIVAAPPLFLALKVVGAGYLIWLAYQAVVHGGGLKVAAAAPKPPTVRQSFLTGVGINLLNPKVVLFFMTFLPQFVDRADPAAPEKLFFLGAEFIAISVPLMILTVVLAEQLTRLLTRTKWVQRALNYSSAAVFTTFAAVILTAQARH
jgi:threonine/homoserine/homoserine lactone efflux protein